MALDKPKTKEEYMEWLYVEHGFDITNRTYSHFDAVSHRIALKFKESNFWKILSEKLGQMEQEYYLKTGYNLFTEPVMPRLDVKSFESFFIKTFRKNIINNENWPHAPDGGWLLPNNWLTRINDIVRTCFVVKYLDGVTLLAEKLKKICESQNLFCKIDYEAKEEGYYAAHHYIHFTCDVPKINWDTEKNVSLIEIQITTQLQEVIKTLLHIHYEERRVSMNMYPDIKWQWNYKSSEFSANYLGHILHYVEGMIMELREKN